VVKERQHLEDDLIVVMNRNADTRGDSGALEIPAGVCPPAIEVVSDVVCPWCYIGKRRLEKALALLGRPDVAVRWKPFQLNPDAP
jgi:hypothetical protein